MASRWFRKCVLVFAGGGLLFAPCRGAPDDSPPPTGAKTPGTLGLGLGYLGGALRWDVNRRVAVQAHYLTSRFEDGGGPVTSEVLGARGYVKFPSSGPLPFFVGAEGSRLRVAQNEKTLRGFAIGGFAGFDFRFGARWSLSTDIGPYVFSLQGAGGEPMDFVINSFLTYYVF